MRHHEYNPFKLPKRIDFHEATKDLPLPRATKTTFQIYLSAQTKAKVREIINQLEQEEFRLLQEAKVASLGNNKVIVIPKEVREKERRELIQKAIYTRASKDFAEKYLISLEAQKKI